MTEKNKRFKVDYDITVGNYCLHDDCKAKGVDGYIAYLSDEERANNLCDLLNEQDARIKYLERKLERERCATQKQHEKWSKQAEERIRELETENKELKEILTKIVFDGENVEIMNGGDVE